MLFQPIESCINNWWMYFHQRAEALVQNVYLVCCHFHWCSPHITHTHETRYRSQEIVKQRFNTNIYAISQKIFVWHNNLHSVSYKRYHFWEGIYLEWTWHEYPWIMSRLFSLTHESSWAAVLLNPWEMRLIGKFSYIKQHIDTKGQDK